jgi:hypothetical protein
MYARFEVLKMVIMKRTAVRGVTTYSLIKIYQRLERNVLLQSECRKVKCICPS